MGCRAIPPVCLSCKCRRVDSAGVEEGAEKTGREAKHDGGVTVKHRQMNRMRLLEAAGFIPAEAEAEARLQKAGRDLPTLCRLALQPKMRLQRCHRRTDRYHTVDCLHYGAT